MKRRFNKVQWNDFREELDSEIASLCSTTENYDTFMNIVKRISRKHIPKGCRTEYIPGLSSELAEYMHTYTEMYERHPFRGETTNKGEELLEAICTE